MSKEKQSKYVMRNPFKYRRIQAGDGDDNIPIKYIAIDGVWGWVVCFACFVGNVIVAGTGRSFGIILPELKRYYNEETAIVALSDSIFSGMLLISSPLAAYLSEKFGLRVVYMAGSLLSGIAFLICTLSPDVYVLIATFGLMGGVGKGLITLPTGIACNYYFEKRTALAVGIAESGLGIGGIVYPPISNFLLELYSWKAVMYMYAGMAFLCSFFAALIRPLETIAMHSEDEQDEIELVDTHNEQDKTKARRNIAPVQEEDKPWCNDLGNLLDLSFWTNSSMLLLMASRFWGQFGISITFMYIPSFLIENGFSSE